MLYAVTRDNDKVIICKFSFNGIVAEYVCKYEISNNFGYICNCESYKFSKNFLCKHIKMVKEDYEGVIPKDLESILKWIERRMPCLRNNILFYLKYVESLYLQINDGYFKVNL